MIENVIVLHGIGLSCWHTAALAKSLRSKYRVYNLSYPSRHHELDELVEKLHQQLQALSIDVSPCHFVGYSMGGILARAYLRRYGAAPGVRVVQVGSPNGGSEVANYFKDWKLFKFLFGPAGQQLTTQATYLKELREAPSDYELGVVAGEFKYDPLGNFCIPTPHDGKVSVDSTRIHSMKDHTIVRISHFTMPYSQKVHWSVRSFLDQGEFIPLEG